MAVADPVEFADLRNTGIFTIHIVAKTIFAGASLTSTDPIRP
jgi:hypothetical protein